MVMKRLWMGILLAVVIGLVPAAGFSETAQVQISATALKHRGNFQDSGTSEKVNELVPLIENALAQTSPDFIVTPEYSLHLGGGERVDNILTFTVYPVRFDIVEGELVAVAETPVTYPSSKNNITPSGSASTAESQKVVDAIEESQALAVNYQTTIFLATVLEIVHPSTENGLSADAVFTTEVIIDPVGKIIGLRRKLTEARTSDQDGAERLAGESVAVVTLTKNGRQYTVLPVICRERWIESFKDAAVGLSADLVAYSEYEGDFDYGYLTESIQDGSFSTDPEAQFTWTDMIRPNWIDGLVGANAFRSGTYVVAADSARPSSGIFQLKDLDPTPLNTWTVNDDEQWVNGTFTITVEENTAPVASFNVDCNDLSCTFTDTSAAVSGGSIVSRSWDFGDGHSSTDQNPSHNYDSSGTYSVTLTVTDGDGTTGSITKPVTVAAPPVNEAPAAGFSFAATELTVNLFDTSTDDNTIESWAWSFGDGGTSTFRNPAHTYASAGTYTVTLTVTDNDGATGSITRLVTTVIVPPAAPGNLTANVQSTGKRKKLVITSATLNWSDSSDNETAFEVQQCRVITSGRGKKATTTCNYATYQNLGPNVTSLAVQTSTGYRYRVRATNSAGVSGFSNEVGI